LRCERLFYFSTERGKPDGLPFISESRFSQDLKDCQDIKNQQNNPSNLNKIKVQDNAGNREGCPNNWAGASLLNQPPRLAGTPPKEGNLKCNRYSPPLEGQGWFLMRLQTTPPCGQPRGLPL
jgi:hypothetical protein